MSFASFLLFFVVVVVVAFLRNISEFAFKFSALIKIDVRYIFNLLFFKDRNLKCEF